MCTGEEMTRQVEDITRRKEELLLQAASIREKVKNFGADNAGMLSELGIVSGVGHYWVWCNLVENCNTELVLALETGTHTEMVDSFNSLNDPVPFHLLPRCLSSSISCSICNYWPSF